jgi:hypothetical protein
LSGACDLLPNQREIEMAQTNEQAGTVPVHEWVLDGRVTGCGTELELQHWKDEGVFNPAMTLGSILCYEPASEDARRKAAWAKP